MIALASARAGMSAGTIAEIAVFCSLSLAIGIGHYRGWHRGWMRFMPFAANFFLPAWFGALGLLVLLDDLALQAGAVLGLVIALPTLLAFLGTLLSLVWLPSRLYPAWFRDEQRRRRARKRTEPAG